MSLDKQKETFNEVLREMALEFSDIKDKIDLNNLVYVYSTGKNKPKVFGNYEMPRKLFDELTIEFSDIKDKIYPNNLVYVYSTGKNKPNDFGNYEMPRKLFEELRDGEIYPREVLENQARLKSDLSEIKIGGKKNQQIKKCNKKCF